METADTMKVLPVLLAALMLASCDSKQDVSKTALVHDVQYYLDNPDARNETITKCNNNPGEFDNTSDCVNAYEASEQAMSESISRAIRQE